MEETIQMRYIRPVKLTHDNLIIDAEGKTLFPEITWKTDLDHIARQRELGEFVVKALNNFESVEDVTSQIALSVNSNNHVPEKKRRGMPKGGWPSMRKKES